MHEDAISQFRPDASRAPSTQPRIAIDAQLLLRYHARRMLIAAAHTAGADVIVPRTAAAVAVQHYGKVSRSHVRRRITSEFAGAGARVSKDHLGEIILERAQRAQTGFGTWLETEAARNDGAFVIAERTRRAERVAGAIYMAGVVTDEKDERREIGEDPYVIGEALDAGAHWVASENLSTISPDAMEDWLDKAQAQGRFTHVPRPFIIEPDTAINTLLERASVETGEENLTRAVALAHALSEPEDEAASIGMRVALLTHCAEGFKRAGLNRAGADLGQWADEAMAHIEQGRPEQPWRDIEAMQQSLPRASVLSALEAETRRMRHEAEAGTWKPLTRPRDDGGRGR